MAVSQEMNNDSWTSWNKRVYIAASSVLVALMMVSFMIAVVQFSRRLNAGWQVTYLPWLGFLLSLEAIYSTNLIRKLSFSSQDWLKMRAAELVVILVILKFSLYLIYSPVSLWFDIQAWKIYLISFFNISYWAAIGVTIFLWVTASQFAEDLHEIGREDYARRQDMAYFISQDRLLARRRLVDRVLVLGAILLLISALVRMDLQFIWGDKAPISGTYINLLLYFVLGFALFSLTQFAILGAAWRQESTPIQRNVASRWVAASLIFLLLLAGLVWFLPTRYSLSLLGALSMLLSYLMFAVFFLVNLISYLFTSLLRLLGLNINQSPLPGEAVQFPELFPPSVVSGQPLPWIEFLKTLLFWSVLIGVIGFALFQYLQQNQELWQAIRRFPLVSWLVKLFMRLGDLFNQARQSVSSAVGAVRNRFNPVRTAGDIPEPWRFIRPRNLSPRQQVQFYFTALLRKAEQRGIQRRKAQTPYEFAQTLEVSIPEMQTDLEPLTGTYVEARYSLHPVTEEQASQARQWWQSLRKIILRKKPAQ